LIEQFDEVFDTEIKSQSYNCKYCIEEIALSDEERVNNVVNLNRRVMSVSTGGPTKLRKTRLYDYFPCDLKPAMLKKFVRFDGEHVDPYENAISRYCIKSTWDPIYRCLDEAAEDTRKLICGGNEYPAEKVDKNIITFKQAVEGEPGLAYFDSIGRSTSAGYPYNCVQSKITKNDIFGVGDAYLFNTVECRKLEADVMEYIDRAERGVATQVYYTDSLKDELRTRSKAEAGATRLVSCSPLLLTIVTRMYFLQACRHLYLNKIMNGIAVGCNPFSTDWDTLARLLLHNSGKNIFSGDFKNFDGSEDYCLLRLAGDVLISWYGLSNNDPATRVRMRIFSDLCSSVHIRGSKVMAWEGSLASGNPLTSIINSIVNQIAFRYTWYAINLEKRLFKDHSHVTPRFDDRVYLCTYGDDNVLSVCDTAADIFNPHNIREAMKDIKLVLTSSEKEAKVLAFSKIDEIDFLKRRFVINKQGTWLCPLNKDSILKPLVWMKSEGNEYDYMSDAVANALLELSQHQEKYYNETLTSIIQASG